LASIFASIFAFGILGCGSSQDNGNSPDAPPPIKDIPAVTAPAVKYNFYEPKSEEGLKNDTHYGYLIAKTRPGFKTDHFDRLGLSVAGCLEANGASYYRLYKESGVLDALKSLKKISSVMFAEPELERKLHAVETDPITFGDGADYYLDNRMQWGAFVTKAYDAWTTYGFGPHRPVVAAVDSGVQYNHEDLKSVVKHAYTWFNAIGNDFYEDPPNSQFGWDPLDAKAVYPDNWGTDFMNHGTHTAGTICASGNNGTGVAGMCWNADFISYQGFGASGVASDWTLFGSIWHLAKWKQDNNYNYTIPVNASFGGMFAGQFEIDVIEYALQNGVMVIASSGNDSYRWHAYPAAYAGVMAVGASDGMDRRAPFSNYGPHLSVAAPGSYIVSTLGAITRHDRDYPSDIKNEYAIFSGTSMAAPHVTGLAGYMLTFNPELKPHEIKTYIERHADYVDGANGYTEEYGWGRINVFNTIKAVIDDVNAGKAPDSSYTAAPVKIKAPMNGLNVFLYNCNEAGTIQNYVANTITGNVFDPTVGVAYFNMLRPGRYIAHAYVGAANAVASTAPFNVTAGQSEVMEVELGLDRDILTIQTFPTQDVIDSDFDNICDTVIGLYDSDGGEVVFLDYTLWDTLATVIPEEPGDYYIHITEFYGDNYLGEYALWLTTGAPWAPSNDGDWITDGSVDYPVAPGAFAAPTGGVKGLQAQSMAAAEAIDFRTIYYGRFNGNPNDGGTSGATGHWYKFTVTPQ
jgi:thermitase